MPMMIVHALGVLLPVMGLVLFPVVLIFMGDVVKPIFVSFGYNILIPGFLFFFMNHILQTKPPTFSQPDISMAKGVPPIGKISFGGTFFPIWPISLLLGVPLVLAGIFGMSNHDVYTSVNFSILMIFGFSMIIASYCLLDSLQKMKVRKDIEKIEDEFSVALFQLGNIISSGAPVELAIDKARENLKNMKIVEMFSIVSMNMKKFGYTFEQALFDKETGAIWYFPSKLIHSIMQAIIESSKKSIKTAADGMIVISNYLKSVHDVKEEINDILGETISSMKFLAMFLAPMVAGVTVTMAVIILQILTRLGSAIASLLGQGGGNAAQSMFLVPWALSGNLPITPASFQLIVGFYMLEIAVLLAVFLNRIMYGEDVIGERNTVGTITIIAIIVYFISWLTIYSMFGGPITQLLSAGLE